MNNTKQQQILLRIHCDALKFYKPKYSQHSYFIKVTPFDLRNKEVFKKIKVFSFYLEYLYSVGNNSFDKT